MTPIRETPSAAPASPDVLVVGGGPAGAVAARQLARRGLSVLLVERARFPRDKVCGGCLSGAAVRQLSALGLLPAAARRLPSLQLRVGRRAVRLRLEGQRAVARATLDAHLLAAAVDAGVHVQTGVQARLGALHAKGRDVQLSDAADGGPPRHAPSIVRAALVLAADGLAGGLRPPQPAAAGARLGLGAHFPAEAADALGCDEGVLMVCGPGGYVGLVRDDLGRLDVAAAADPAAVRTQGPAAWVDRLLVSAGLPALPPGTWHATPSLTRRAADDTPRVLPLGDAAGYVEPFTGEGIGWALAAAVAVTPFVVDGWQPGLEARWRSHLRRVSHRRLVRVSAAALRHPWLVAAGVALLRRAPALARPVLRTLGQP